MILTAMNHALWFLQPNKVVAQPGTIAGSIGVAFGKCNALQALRDHCIGCFCCDLDCNELRLVVPAASANKIVAQPGTITGSIGVAFGKFNALQALRDQGVNVDTVAVGKNATASSPFHDFTKEQRQQVNVLMDRCVHAFI